jgi:hypothetical protein
MLSNIWIHILTFKCGVPLHVLLTHVPISPDVAFSKFDPYYGTLVESILGRERHENLTSMVAGSKENFDSTSDESKSLQPHGIAAHPVYDSLDRTVRRVMGYTISILSWDLCVYRLLPEGVNGMIVIFRNTCGQSLTYRINGPNVRNQL